jgi:hypothetical protein
MEKKYNNELYTLYKESDIVTYIKMNRLKWAGHVIRMEEQSPTRRVLIAVVEGRRQRGRPKLRWEDGVMEDARKLGECCTEQGWLAEASRGRPWLKKGCCADDDDDELEFYSLTHNARKHATQIL